MVPVSAMATAQPVRTAAVPSNVDRSSPSSGLTSPPYSDSHSAGASTGTTRLGTPSRAAATAPATSAGPHRLTTAL